MKTRINALVAPAEEGQRLDRMLAVRFPEYSRSRFLQWIRTGAVCVNEKVVKPSYRVQSGDHIEIDIPAPEPDILVPEPVTFDILYQDEDLIVVNKPAGLVVHPGAGNRKSTLVHGLLHRFDTLSSIGAPFRPGIVHRLDQGTSGVMVIARSDRAHRRLALDFKEHRICKEYQALVRGRVQEPPFTIDLPIGRHRRERKRMSVRTNKPRPARTEILSSYELGAFSLLSLRIMTGRTHQIRVHLTAIGTPVIGDPLYGRKSLQGLPGQQLRNLVCALKGPALHASVLEIEHPVTGIQMRWSAPPRPALRLLIEFLQKI